MHMEVGSCHAASEYVTDGRQERVRNSQSRDGRGGTTENKFEFLSKHVGIQFDILRYMKQRILMIGVRRLRPCIGILFAHHSFISIHEDGK